MLFLLTVRLITINNSYLARAAHCPDKSSLSPHGESPIKCSRHGDRDCWEYAGSDLNTHIIPCLDTATDNVPCHIQIDQTEWELHEWHKQWTWTLNKEFWFNPKEITLYDFMKLDTTLIHWPKLDTVWNVSLLFSPVVCCEAVLSSLEDRRPGLPVVRLVAGPGGQYTLLEGADIHLPLSPSPRSSINSLPSEKRGNI